MSLKARLRIFVVALMISVVSALSALNLYTLARVQSEDALKRTQMSAQQLANFVNQRRTEQLQERRIEPQTIEEMKAISIELVKTDDQLPGMLLDTLANSPAIVEILISGPDGEILADSSPMRVGHKTYELPDFEKWVERKSPWGKLIEIFSHRQDYQTTIPLGLQNNLFYTVKVVVSSVLLRETMLSSIQIIALIFLGSLLLSTMLAIVVSNLALRPLAAINQMIDRISKGEFEKPVAPPDGGLREYSAVQSKLNVLGQQFRGAKEDVMQLRSNIEQLLERLDEIVLLFDRDDRLVMAGRAAERLLGRGRWELMGRALSELFPSDTVLGSTIQSALELRQPVRDYPITFERAGIAPARLLANVEILEGFPRHERLGTLITLRDVESRRQLQSQLDISTRLAAISRLTGGVAHEIKNPLQAMRVHLEVLRSKLAGQDSTPPEIDTIDREIMRLDRVVKTFLDFTRPVELQMRKIEVTGLVKEVGTLVGPSADRQNVKLDIQTSPEEIYIHGDRDLLQQAILNVVVNGVEAMKQGGALHISVDAAAGDCVVMISDEGPGIPPEIQDKIFNLYFSTKGKGSGIGLAMTFRIVQLHNGTIDFKSEPGKGTTFRLRLPAIEDEPFPEPRPAIGTQKLA